MKAPINSKEDVLYVLRVRLNIAQAVVDHSLKNMEPSRCQVHGTAAVRDLAEAIRFIEEHAE